MLTTIAGCVMHPAVSIGGINMRCVYCVNQVPVLRYEAGYNTCLSCGDRQASKVRHCIVPMHKSNYMVVTNRADLIGINSKGGLVK